MMCNGSKSFRTRYGIGLWRIEDARVLGNFNARSYEYGASENDPASTMCHMCHVAIIAPYVNGGGGRRHDKRRAMRGLLANNKIIFLTPFYSV